MTTHRHPRTPKRAILPALVLTLTGATLAATTTPASAAPAPVTAPDTVTLTSGQSAAVKVLNNDTISGGKKNATLTVIASPRPTKVRVTPTRRLKVTVRATAKPGTYRTTYQVTDTYGKTATGVLSVNVAATTADPTLIRNRLDALPVATEQRTGYDRDLYKHWTDADSDGCDTRREALLAEAVSKPSLTTGCGFNGGTWFSYYDNATTTDSSTFDVDHMVALAEAHDSGGHSWNADTRMRFANDLDDPRSLVAVSASSNRSKSDRDPAEWMPPAPGDTVACRYLIEWVAVKTRWSLSVDPAEKNAISAELTQHSCPNASIPVTKAPVTTTNNPTPTTPPPTTPSPAAAVTIDTITYNPEGDDNLGEFVTLTNNHNQTLNLRGWTLTDAANHTYTFPTTNLTPGATFTVRVSTGTNTATVFHTGQGAIWNNTGDTATLNRADGTTADACTYTGTTTGVATC